MLYQNDGVYGNFMNVIMEKEVMLPLLCGARKTTEEFSARLMQKAEDEKTQNTQQRAVEHRYSIWGPTCDSIDCVVREATLESEVKVGDWLKYTNMGGKSYLTMLNRASQLILYSIYQYHRNPI